MRRGKAQEGQKTPPGTLVLPPGKAATRAPAGGTRPPEDPPTPSLEGFEAALRDDNLGTRTIEEYRGIVRRGLEAPDPLTYIKGIANLRSRSMPLAAFQHWAKYTKNAELAAELKAHKDSLRHRIPPARERQPFTAEEMGRLASGIDGAGRDLPERFALRVLLRTGARSSDICSGVTREVLQLSMAGNGWAQIRTKGKRLRRIDFSDFGTEVGDLLSTPGWSSLYELLAPARDGRPCTNKRGYRVLDLRFKTLCAACEVSKPWITHRCRHTLASIVYASTGKNLIETRDFFGWASTQTAERYTHGAQVEDIKKRIAGFLPDVSGAAKPPKRPKGKR